jgi:hypothetical protein
MLPQSRHACVVKQNTCQTKGYARLTNYDDLVLIAWALAFDHRKQYQKNSTLQTVDVLENRTVERIIAGSNFGVEKTGRKILLLDSMSATSLVVDNTRVRLLLFGRPILADAQASARTPAISGSPQFGRSAAWRC